MGQLTALTSCEKEDAGHFLILEPMGGIPTRYLDEILMEEDATSEAIDEKFFGELRVQKRIKL